MGNTTNECLGCTTSLPQFLYGVLLLLGRDKATTMTKRRDDGRIVFMIPTVHGLIHACIHSYTHIRAYTEMCTSYIPTAILYYTALYHTTLSGNLSAQIGQRELSCYTRDD